MCRFLCIKDSDLFEKGETYFGEVETDGTLAISLNKKQIKI